MDDFIEILGIHIYSFQNMISKLYHKLVFVFWLRAAKLLTTTFFSIEGKE